MATSNKRFVRFTVIFIVISLVFVQTSCAYGAQSETDQTITFKNFSDLKTSHWAYDSIMVLVEKGGIKGYPDGTFRPNDPITNAELASILIGATGHDNSVTGSWATGIWEKAKADGLIDGAIDYSDSMADWETPRETMAMLLANSASKFYGEKLTTLDAIDDYIRDMNAINSLDMDRRDPNSVNVYKKYVNECVAMGLVQGNNNHFFLPEATLTRAEAATICMRLIDKSKRVTPTKHGITFTDAEKNAAMSSFLKENPGRVSRFMTAAEFVNEFGMKKSYYIPWEHKPNVLAFGGFWWMELNKATAWITPLINSEPYENWDDLNFKGDRFWQTVDTMYAVAGTYIPDHCTSMVVQEPGTWGLSIVVIGNPFKIIGF